MAVLRSCTSNNYSYKLPMTALQSVVQLTGYTATSNECHQLKRQPAQTNTIAMHYQIWLQKFLNTISAQQYKRSRCPTHASYYEVLHNIP